MERARPEGIAPARLTLYRTLCVGDFMAKLAIFLFGFLALTLMIGALATISPV